jgi:hypothetical protein
MVYSETWGTVIHEKNPEGENLVALSFKAPLNEIFKDQLGKRVVLRGYPLEKLRVPIGVAYFLVFDNFSNILEYDIPALRYSVCMSGYYFPRVDPGLYPGV